MPYTKGKAKEKLRELIEKFKRELEEGKIKHFNEEQVKKDYIEPFFEYLNWNVRHSDEVSVEEKISKGRVDYSFKMDGISKFYVEAKAPKEDLNNNVFMEQAINYAWLKSVTWTILTNFEELRVFNAEWESKNPRDKIYIDLKWDEFLDKFDRIWLLSKDSFLNNELDKEAEEYGKKIKKTPVTPVMRQIFNDLMAWRENLTKNIMSFNSNRAIIKTEEELDEAIQRIIDRLIFIRVCEDREIEKVILQPKLREWVNSHNKHLVDILNDIFREFDKGYNSRLFAPHPSENLKIDDGVLAGIIKNLYESSDGVFKYDFSVIDVDVLGNIYEEYLGYILRKGKKRAGIKENHAYRKEMGIYYTPTFIVDYIVKNTLGKVLKQKDIEDIKVLDMACGSGSFLLKAFDFLINFHKNKLDFLRKVKILTNNIYGVDLDPKAIEIAQLNLLLKTLERRRLLPKLQENLRVGNSLIDDKTISDRAFDWHGNFKEILGKSGFDAIIGNPPYIRIHQLPVKDKTYFEKNYKSAIKQYDIYVLFYEKAINLLKDGGRIGFITSNKFTITDYGLELRKFILDNCAIEQVIDVSNFPVFKDASTYPYIFILRKELNLEKRNKNEIRFIEISDEKQLLKNHIKVKVIEQSKLLKQQKNLFIFSIDEKDERIIKKVQKGENLISIFRARPTTKNIVINPSDKSNYIKALTNRDIKGYSYKWDNQSFLKKEKRFIIDTPAIFMKKICERLTATIVDAKDIGAVNTVYIVNSKDNKVDLKFLLAILNSKLIDYFTKKLYFSTHMRGGYIELRTFEIEQIPIIVKKDLNNQIVELVDIVLGLNKELEGINTNSDRGKEIQEKIIRIDRQIDQKVYELYGLTEEEIKAIENN